MTRLANFALTLTLATAFAAAADAQSKATPQAQIPPQPLIQALTTFADQTGLQLMYVSDLAEGRASKGAPAGLTPEQTLTRLLEGTDLTYEFLNDRTIAIKSRKTTSTAKTIALSTSGENPPSPREGRRAGDEGLMRIAQNEEQSSSKENNPPQPSDKKDEELSEVVVTGTNIRGAAPIGVGLIKLDRIELDKMGLGTAQEVLKSLPQAFGGGPSEDTTSGLEASQNAARSSSVNLRGLGAGATLVLVNGRRMAAGGGEGRVTDISSIPLTAIERIEVLPDGASAIYGSDAVGGVVNFVLRKDYDGAESRVRFGAVDSGGLEERQVGQTFGTKWASGQGLISYEYYKRNPMLMSDRELTASQDLRPLGGTDRRDVNSNPGTIFSGANTWAIPVGQDGTDLDPSTLVLGTSNRENLNESRDLFPDQQRHSLIGSFTQSVGDTWSVFTDLFYSRRDTLFKTTHDGRTLSVPSTNPFYVNPMGGTANVSVRYRFTDDLGRREQDIEVQTYSAALGTSASIGEDWKVTVSANYAGEEVEQIQDFLDTVALAAALRDPNPATAFNPFGDGSNTNPETLRLLEVKSSFDSTSSIAFANAIADGSIASLPGGDLRLAFGSEYRQHEFGIINQTPGFSRETEFDRDITAAFAEVRAPLIGAANRMTAVERLDLSIAGRYERYSDFGSAVTPRVGLEWAPLSALSFRGSWSQSFKAPNLADLTEVSNNTTILTVADPASPTGQSRVLGWFGKNADLQEETATSWTAGLELRDPSRPSRTVSLSYFEIVFDDRIDMPPATLTWLSNPRFAGLVTRDPTPEQRANACSRSTPVGITPADCLSAPIAALVDTRVNNFSRTEARGLDALALYDFDTRIGRFDFALNATYQLDFKQALLNTDPLVELVNTVSSPLRLRGRSSFGWNRNGISARVSANYVDDYRDTVSQPNTRLASWTTVDLHFGYDGHAGTTIPWLENVSASLNVQNVLDEDPSFFNNPAGIGYDPENADLLGRFVSFQIRKGW